MTSKQRVRAALRREPADRPPIWMWFHAETARRLAQALRIEPSRLADALGDDIRQTWIGNNHAMEAVVHERDGETHTDEWGVEWVKSGPFNQIRRAPLERADDATLLAYRYPYDRIPALLEFLKPLMAQADRFFVGADVSPCLFEMVCRLRGLEQASLDLVESPPRAAAMLEHAGAFSLALSQAALARFELDWLWTGDDVGGQQATIMSPSCWREMIKPRLVPLFAAAHARGVPVAFHSCGAIRPLIPDLIEIGLDVLNPIQCQCPGMDPTELKREFGAHLAFMGGVDSQRLLPFGTPAEVYRETRRLIETMTEGGGGYIVAATHTVPPETPIENILALYAAAGVSREEIAERADGIRAGGRSQGDGGPLLVAKEPKP